MTPYEGLDLSLIIVGGFSVLVASLVGVIHNQSTKRMDSQNASIVELFERISAIEKSSIYKGDLKDALEPIKEQLKRLLDQSDEWQRQCGRTCIAVTAPKLRT